MKLEFSDEQKPPTNKSEPTAYYFSRDAVLRDEGVCKPLSHFMGHG